MKAEGEVADIIEDFVRSISRLIFLQVLSTHIDRKLSRFCQVHIYVGTQVETLQSDIGIVILFGSRIEDTIF